MSRDDSKARSGKELPDDDDLLFRQAVADARPLKSPDRLEPYRRRPPPRARFARDDERAVLGEILDSPSDEIEAGSGDALGYHRDGVGGRVYRKLARGRYSIQAEIDLHGMNVPDAREALHGFIESALKRGLTCVRVVHGKGRGSGHGGPVLKRKVDGWLRQWGAVLAFVSARQADGGTGAVYVLLKRL